MGRASFGLILLAVAAVTGLAHGQVDSCDSELPAVLSSNFSGLSCKPVWNNFVLRYSQDHDNVLSIVLSAVYTTGWVGMGFSKDGMMVGSSAMVGWIGKTGVMHIKQFYLGGKSSSAVKADGGQLQLTAVRPAVAFDQAKIYLAFQSKFSAPVTQQNLLFAIGSAVPVNNHLQEHIDKASITFDFSAGTSTASSYPYNLKRSHGAVNIFGWGVLLPIGVIIARYCKQRDPLWYYLHAIIQLIGFIFGLAGVVAGVALNNKLHANVSAHRGLGIFILVLGILQVLAFFLRPGKDSKMRRYWNWYHHWAGRLLLFLAAVNIFVGIHVGGAGASWKGGYGFVLAALLVTCIILEVLWRTRWSKGTTTPPTFQVQLNG